MAIRSQSLTDFLEAQKTIEETKADIGPTIRYMRQNAGMSQMFAAASAGVTQAYLSQVENGHKTPSADSLGRIVKVVSEGSTSGKDDHDGKEEDEA
jgi:transcriptional regulator with XRE-family HTH domain